MVDYSKSTHIKSGDAAVILVETESSLIGYSYPATAPDSINTRTPGVWDKKTGVLKIPGGGRHPQNLYDLMPPRRVFHYAIFETKCGEVRSTCVVNQSQFDAKAISAQVLAAECHPREIARVEYFKYVSTN